MSKPKGNRVLINCDPYGIENLFAIKAEVKDLLSVQFTAEWDDTGTLSYLFYHDEGSTWINDGDG